MQRWMATFGMVGLVALVVAAGVVFWVMREYRAMTHDGQGKSRTAGKTRRAAAPEPTTSSTATPPRGKTAPTATTAARPTATVPPRVPDDTKQQRIGAIDVVDVGLSAATLRRALAQQLRIARSNRQRMLLMLTGTGCTPCRGFDSSLQHPAMQRALKGVRLVRVDLKVFREELARLRLPIDKYPVFVLLDRDIRPIDGIHGGEWDEDIAENIAPVLSSFLRGTYKVRRDPNWAPSTKSVRL